MGWLSWQCPKILCHVVKTCHQQRRATAMRHSCTPQGGPAYSVHTRLILEKGFLDPCLKANLFLSLSPPAPHLPFSQRWRIDFRSGVPLVPLAAPVSTAPVPLVLSRAVPLSSALPASVRSAPHRPLLPVFVPSLPVSTERGAACAAGASDEAAGLALPAVGCRNGQCWPFAHLGQAAGRDDRECSRQGAY